MTDKEKKLEAEKKEAQRVADENWEEINADEGWAKHKTGLIMSSEVLKRVYKKRIPVAIKNMVPWERKLKSEGFEGKVYNDSDIRNLLKEMEGDFKLIWKHIFKEYDPSIYENSQRKKDHDEWMAKDDKECKQRAKESDEEDAIERERYKSGQMSEIEQEAYLELVRLGLYQK